MRGVAKPAKVKEGLEGRHAAQFLALGMTYTPHPPSPWKWLFVFSGASNIKNSEQEFMQHANAKVTTRRREKRWLQKAPMIWQHSPRFHSMVSLFPRPSNSERSTQPWRTENVNHHSPFEHTPKVIASCAKFQCVVCGILHWDRAISPRRAPV